MTGVEGYDMFKSREDIYKRPSFEDFTRLDEDDRAGDFAQEYHTKHNFNEQGRAILLTEEDSRKILHAIPAYIEEQEALFQQKLAAKAAKNNTLTP